MRELHDIAIQEPEVTIEEVNRLLEIGRILLETLTPDELEWLSTIIIRAPTENVKIGNTGVT